ncbi:ribosomal protein S18-alanine N-acetyltransferase [Thiomicrorhabdus arctica]|uniref:ribosomal protein S18-alanine N-acetyltransferase n=1 Tax=Thiomicrorhabdus arctica TaxID=131540 RepID=UPI00037AD687|nr:ribosomal protein S18-alanine N-acetyltransferase [Thiomicrorhabdus arctica]
MSGFSYLQVLQDADLPWVMSVEQRAYDFPWTLKGFENSMNQGLNYLFKDEDHKSLGYCCVLPVLDEATLLNVCVAPEHQGRRIARPALEQIFAKLKENAFQIVFLEVRASNEPAIKLYQSIGFSEDGVRKGYYRAQVWDEQAMELVEEREDAILMSYSLVD